jgi:hypothetical protein
MTKIRFNNSIVPSLRSVLLATAIAWWLDPQADALTLPLAPGSTGNVHHQPAEFTFIARGIVYRRMRFRILPGARLSERS